MSAVTQATELLLKSHLRRSYPSGRSLDALMREFLRREALWARRLGVDEDLPFVNLAYEIDPQLGEPELLDTIKDLPRSSAERLCYCNMLGWYILKDARPELIDAFNLPDPYEPLLRFLERGGSFSAGHWACIDIEMIGMIKPDFVQKTDLNKPITSIDTQTLDSLDPPISSW